MLGRTLRKCVTLFLLAGVACSGSAKHATRTGSTSSTSSTSASETASWSNATFRPATSVVAIGGLFVVFGTSDGTLSLYGLNPSTGSVVWKRPATRGDAAPGISLGVTVEGTNVFYLRPTPDGKAEALVAADAATGSDRWVSPAASFDSGPDDCGDGGTVCAGVESVGIVAFASATGARRRLDLPAGARSLGTGIYDLGSRNPESIAAVDERGREWTATISDVFGPNHSTDGGWEFELYKPEHIYAASVAPTPPSDHQSPPSQSAVVDLTTTSTVGLDVASGKRQWVIPKSNITCEGTLFITSDSPVSGPPLPVACMYSGTATFDQNGPTTLSGPTTVVGFDVATGTIKWRWKSNADPALVDAEKPHVQVGDDSVVLPNESGDLFIVNLRDGSSRPVSPSTGGWCTTAAMYTTGPTDPKNPDANKAAGGLVRQPCKPDGSPGGPPTEVPRNVGATIGTVTAYASPTAVVALNRK